MFSVIIPVHNKLPHLDRSIYSVLNQTYKDFELILIDDASSDGSENRIKKYKDPRIRLYKRQIPGPGGYAARNLGIEKAKYDWICFLDADDEWELHYLTEKLKVIQQNEDAEIISSKWIRSENGKKIYDTRFNHIENKYYDFNIMEFLNFNSFMWTSAVTIKKDVLLKSSMFPAGKCNRGGDLDTWIRCLINSKRNIFINNVAAIYYIDSVNQVTKRKSRDTSSLCSMDTLIKLKKDINNRELHKAIDDYFARHVYNVLSRNIIDFKRDNELLRIIDSPSLRLNITFKLSIKKYIMNIKKYFK